MRNKCILQKKRGLVCFVFFRILPHRKVGEYSEETEELLNSLVAVIKNEGFAFRSYDELVILYRFHFSDVRKMYDFDNITTKPFTDILCSAFLKSGCDHPLYATMNYEYCVDATPETEYTEIFTMNKKQYFFYLLKNLLKRSGVDKK